MSDQTIRSFIAIELPQAVKTGLQQLQTELTLPRYSFVKCVSPEGIHLTLKFLGNISAQKVTDITGVMEQASQGVNPFQLQLTEVGAFPNMRRPRVLWVGIKGEVDKLVGWQQRIDMGLVPLGFAKEARPFTPHLTLARLRENCSSGDRLNFGEMFANAHVEVDYNFTVSSLNLMKSQLLPAGAVYSRLTEVKLKR
ncbi:MAG: RNA 2',3'-cyclic phosphodiesterase [Dehalococcoidia bacterium]|nr:RNA 2',3'-cyclic phosphodiesterase [Dehalococcoidia bacterium]